jgi:hypothetical protein
MGTDDASFAEMRRRLTDPDADPLALDDETVERLLAGDLPPSQAPPGYARVAALLAATTAEPTAEELAGQAEALAELRAVTRRPRRAAAHTRRAARPPRRRWAGLAAAALVGALVTGGVAVAASGNLPAPVRDVARSILGTVGGGDEGDHGSGPATPTQPDAQPAPVTPSPAAAGTTAGPKGPLPTGSTAPGSGSRGAGPVAAPDREGLCKAYLASQDKQHAKKMDATAFERLAEAAGGESKIPAYCEGVQPGHADPKEDKGRPADQGQGQGGPPTSTGGHSQGQSDAGTRSPSR